MGSALFNEKDVVATAEAAGWTVAHGTDELQLTPPDGGQALRLFLGNKQGIGRAVKNQLAALRRLGLVFDDQHAHRSCEHTWHATGEPGRSCPYCRGIWRTGAEDAAEPQEDDSVKRDMKNPPQRERWTCSQCPQWFWVDEVDRQSIHELGHAQEKERDRVAVLEASRLNDNLTRKKGASVARPKRRPVVKPAVTTPLARPVVEPARPGGNVTFEIETITPTMAKAWLAKNKNNRKLRVSRVALYKRDMLSDAWSVNGEGIKFDENGDLSDGQHRLQACVEANVPFTSLVVRNLAPQARATMDIGAVRTLGDTLRWMGEPYCQALASAIMLSWKWDNGTIRSPERPSKHDALEWFDKNQHIRDAVREASPFTKAPLRAAPSALAAFYARVMLAEPDEAPAFLASLAKDTDFGDGDAVLALRRFFIKQATTRGSVQSYVVVAHLVKAWNAWISGSYMKNLSWRSGGSSAERFPYLLDAEGVPYEFPDVVDT